MTSGVRESSEPPSPESAFDESCAHACAGDSRRRAAGALVLSVQTQQSAFPGCLRRFKGTWVSALTLKWI